ncbi:hypothetical protein FE257_012348 [Aspergillus nanangensis]|uniref:Uncharacterized protein n=1 Tax=Aspergillus nanangensis TaxID=2582783 RepID=A0AAD4CFW6_ASPNN|nr:hypothetical protein FE257_012348 [Aspergillus nanangensis]
MGHKVSAVTGVKSDNYYDPGNAINEVWVGDVEVISRMPFGDSDIGQAGWTEDGVPKIPWKNFIIPMKRDMSAASSSVTVDPVYEYIKSMAPYTMAFYLSLIGISLVIELYAFVGKYRQKKSHNPRHTQWLHYSKNSYRFEFHCCLIRVVLCLVYVAFALYGYQSDQGTVTNPSSLEFVMTVSFVLGALVAVVPLHAYLSWRCWRMFKTQLETMTHVKLEEGERRHDYDASHHEEPSGIVPFFYYRM